MGIREVEMEVMALSILMLFFKTMRPANTTL
jgi:hypothetical protein